jgi:hypothetical protein
MHRITSYINNLHSHGNEALYRAIESVISAALPLWDLSLTALQNRSKLPVNRIEVPQYFKFLDESGAEIDQNKWYDEGDELERTLVLPDAGDFDSDCLPAFLGGPERVKKEEKIDLERKYKDSGPQVIVKLANIELTPDKPEYEGGSWHVEGNRTSISAPRQYTTTARTSPKATWYSEQWSRTNSISDMPKMMLKGPRSILVSSETSRRCRISGAL